MKDGHRILNRGEHVAMNKVFEVLHGPASESLLQPRTSNECLLGLAEATA